MADDGLNTIFEQDGKVYAVCAHDVPRLELTRFISSELRYAEKHIPRFKMRVVTTEEVRKMPFGKPEHFPLEKKKKQTKSERLL